MFSTITARCLSCGSGLKYHHAHGDIDYDITDPNIPDLIKLSAHGGLVACVFCGSQHLIKFDMLSDLYLKEVVV